MTFLLWLKKWWKWVLAGLAVLLAFIVGLLIRKPPVITPGPPPEKKKAEDDADAQKKHIQEVRDTTIAKIVSDAAKATEVKIEEIKTNTDTVKDDPEKVNDYLHDVGKELRQ